jgi:hypothetical protein
MKGFAGKIFKDVIISDTITPIFYIFDTFIKHGLGAGKKAE